MGVLLRFRRRDSGRHAGKPYDPWTAGFDQHATQAINTVRDTPPRTEPLAATQARTEQFPAARQLASEHRRWYGWDNSPPVLRRTADALRGTPRRPDPLTDPLPPPGPLSFRDDWKDFPEFRAATRTRGFAPARLVRTAPALPDFRIAEIWAARITGGM